MKLLLDTHTLIWAKEDPSSLGKKAMALLGESLQHEILVSSISLWEIAKLHEKKRIQFSTPVLDWLELALASPRLRVIEMSAKIAVASASLPGSFHGDPADQIMVATARLEGATILTKDRQILDYHYVQSAW